jgi:hypothetical protein
VRFVDYIEIGTDFVHDGSLVMSDQSFATYFPWRNAGGDPLSTIDFGLVRLNANADAKLVAAIRHGKKLGIEGGCNAVASTLGA